MRLVCGVGINDLGWSQDSKHSEYERKVYKTWYDMLCRCYSERELRRYPSYKGCSVCEHWKVLSNFEKDIKSLPNYDKWLNGGYDLDKDVRLGHCMVYDVEHCMFVTKSDNRSESANRCNNHRLTIVKEVLSRQIQIERLDGSIEVYSNSLELANKLNISRQSVSSWMCGRRKSYTKYGIASIKYLD